MPTISILLRAIFSALPVLLFMVALPGVAGAGGAAGPTFERHGVAAPVSEARGVLAARDAGGKRWVVTYPMDRYQGGLRMSLLLIDPDTGQARQFWYPDPDTSNGASYHSLRTDAGRVYTMFGSTFLEFDLNRPSWRFVQEKCPGTAMTLTEGPDGMVYVGTYPTANLLAYNPQTRELRDWGRLDPTEKYPFHLAVGDDGWIYAGLGTARTSIVAIKPGEAEPRQLLEDDQRVVGAAQVYRGQDGKVYGRSSAKHPWLHLHNGQAELLEGEPAPAEFIANTRWQRMIEAFGDGWTIRSLSLAERELHLRGPDGQTSAVDFDYASNGANIASVVPGPDGKVYGSTSHPMRVFALDPESGSLSSLGGIERVGGGNFADFTHLDGLVYGLSYSHGDLYAYDPARQWTSAEGEAPNPQLVANARPHIHRPRFILTHPDGQHIVAGGFPGYGRVGGGLLIYAPETGEAETLANEQLLPGLSMVTADVLDATTLVLGTSINTPGGGTPTADVAELALLDWPSRQISYHTIPVPGAKEIASVRVGPDGLVYGLTREATVFVFDPEQRKVIWQKSVRSGGRVPSLSTNALLVGPEGQVYLILSNSINVIRTAPFDVQQLDQLPRPATATGGILNGRLYYGHDGELWSYRLPTGR